MERSNQEQEQLRHQLGLTQSAFETWLFFQEATARRLAEQLPKPDKKEETFQDPQRSKRWEAGLPFRVGCKNNQKKQTTFPSLHTTFARQVQKAQLKIWAKNLSTEVTGLGGIWRQGQGYSPGA